MTWNELCEIVGSPTLQRDIQTWDETGNKPGGYTKAELYVMYQYIVEGGESDE